MLFSTIYFVLLLSVYAIAIPLKKEQQTVLQQTSTTLKNDVINLTPSTVLSTKVIQPTLSNTLTNYYENIVDQVMATTMDAIISSAPHSCNLLYPSYDCQASRRPFINALRSHLNLMRSNLIASVRPLFESSLQTLLYQTTSSSNSDFINTAHATSNHLTEPLIVLNQKLSIQLGLIINADDTADIIIHQSAPWNYLEHRVYRSHHRQVSSKTWSRPMDEKLGLDSGIVNNYTDKANKALAEWLRLWLSDIENILYTQFDDSIEYVSRTILDSF